MARSHGIRPSDHLNGIMSMKRRELDAEDRETLEAILAVLRMHTAAKDKHDDR